MGGLMRQGSLAAALALAVHYLCFLAFGVPLWTDVLGEWIMARTPNTYSVWLLESMGAWAKPFALTGGLFLLGIGTTVATAARGRWRVPAMAAMGVAYVTLFAYPSWPGALSYWGPAAAAALWLAARPEPFNPRRRAALSGVMAATTVLVALEGYLREERLARRAAQPVDLWPFHIPSGPLEADGLRPPVTEIGRHYTMSKNSVDPLIDPAQWRLRVTVDGVERRVLSYAQLLALPRERRYVTLRCISNTLRSDLMGTAEWAGFPLAAIAAGLALPESIQEVAFLGVDGHGDSLPLAYALSPEVFLALGMNGRTLNRGHGYPLRMLCPRYYGFKNVKWIGEIAFVSTPYYGTWPKMGYLKEATVKIASYIDRARRHGGEVRVAGVSFAGSRGVDRVEIRAIRADGSRGEWLAATLENPLSPYTWTRWAAVCPAEGAVEIEARARDGAGTWQATEESKLFPGGVAGPTLRKISV